MRESRTRTVAGFDVLLPGNFVHTGDPAWIDIYTQRCAVTGLLLLCADNARWINHSDDPNVDTTLPLFHTQNIDRALRDIAAGEELTMDYTRAEDEPFKGFPGCSRPEKIF